LRKSPPANSVVSSIFGQEPLAQWTERNEADPEPLQRRQDLGFGLSPPEGVLALERSDRLGRVSATAKSDLVLKLDEGG
jgi:hypothetical protein